MDTEKKAPWYQGIGKPSESHFAVCPSCDNPIQIIRLYPKTETPGEPYGKHICKNIEKLASCNRQKMLTCPLLKPVKFDRSERVLNYSGNKEYLGILRSIANEFDKIVQFTTSITGIGFSKNKLRSMLQSYLTEQGYLYITSSLNNYPWMFLYFSNSTEIYFQNIYDDKLSKALTENVLGSVIKDNLFKREGDSYVSASVAFLFHRSVQRKNYVGETFLMSVTDTSMNRIFKKEIAFDYAGYSAFPYTPDNSYTWMAKDIISRYLGFSI